MAPTKRIAALGVMLIAFPLMIAAQAPEQQYGTWTLNLAKSTFSPGLAPQSQTTVVTALPGGGAMMFTTDTIDSAGRSSHQSFRLDARIRNPEFVERINGKITTRTKSTVSADGKTRTNVTTSTNADGAAVKNTSVYDRQ